MFVSASAQITMMIKTCVIRFGAPAILLAGVLSPANPAPLKAQTALAQAPAASPSVIQSLLDKAHALEQRGRLDLAEQTWQQILLTDPNNTQALAGLARAARLNHSPTLANSYLERLRAINPNDPNIAAIENLNTGSSQDQNTQLQQAARLAEAGQYAAAMAIYRRVFGSKPPTGDWALAYYETEAATEDGRPQAIAGLRALLDKDPANRQYRIALGRVLTYDPATREEGREYLGSFLTDPKAAEAYRQSLLWDAPNPAMAPVIRAYLANHPDPQLAAALQSGRSPSSPPLVSAPAAASITPSPAAPPRQSTPAVSAARTPAPAVPPTASISSHPTPGKIEPAPAPAEAKPSAAVPSASTPPVVATTTPKSIPAESDGSARTRAAEMAAYTALNANHIDDAEARFKAILAAEPQNPRALAGMGYVRMQQGNFAGAIGFLEQARQLTPGDKGLASALDTARFWFEIGEGRHALSDNDLATAEKRYQAALDLRPNSMEALEGLGSTLTRAQQPGPAAALFQRAVVADPTSVSAWRGLFIAQVQSGNAALALATDKQTPPAIHTQLNADPLYQLSLASAYSAAGRPADAQQTLEASLKLTFPPDNKTLKADTQLQLAALLVASNRLDGAAALYNQVLAADPANPAALQGLVGVQHALGQDAAALKTIQSMPPPVYEAVMRDPSFAATVASIDLANNKPDDALLVMQNALAQQSSNGNKPSPALQVQLAGLYVQRGKPQLALPIYQQVTRDHPDRADAWAGLVSTLHIAGRDKEVPDQVKAIPPAVRAQLESNAAYLQTMASVYQALGRSREAAPFLNRVEQENAAERKATPADVEIQNAWLLYNGMEDDQLYRQLMALGSRTDLTPDQRRTVQTIWTNWAVRRANQAVAGGNPRLALAILNAAAHSFPDNPAAIKALAAGYAQAGQPQQAVAIYKAQNMSSASSADYQAAIGAALAAHDNKQAEIWLRYALAAYPNDPQVLILGARFEQARGDTNRAIKYYRQSLKAMPPAPPAAKAASPLGLPAPTAPLSLPNPDQPHDLNLLLAPDSSALPSSAPASQSPPYLPGYSNQLPPYDGTSRVVPPYMTNPGGASQTPSAGAPAQPDVASTVRNAATQVLDQPQAADVTPEAYQQQQIAQLNRQAAAQPAPIPGQEAYAPDASYIPPPPAASRTTTNTADRGVTGQSVLPVQLGNDTPPPAQPQTDMTDVLPTARYAPSARAAEAAREEPALEAARASRIRQFEEESTARSGQSHPPNDGAVDVPTRNAAYAGPSQQGGAQVPQPSSTPQGPFANIPDTGAQQYPQPRTPPAPSASSSAPRRTVARLPAIPPEPQLTTPPAPAPALAPATMPQPPQPAPPPASTPAPPIVSPLSPPAYPLAPPPTDAELQARNLPALRGEFSGQVPLPMSPRQQAEGALASLEGSYSGWLGPTGYGRYRSGTPGLDRLYDFEAPVEASAVVARTVRVTAVALPVFLNSGPLNTAGFTSAYVPYLGTLPANFSTAPAQQYSYGIGGELQLATKDLEVAGGYTPYRFLVHNFTGRAHFTTLGGHLELFGLRDSVKDTQLSYAGLRDPGEAAPGPIWGGVIATTGGARVSLGSSGARFYFSGGGGQLTGRHVLTNTMFQAATGASFRVYTWPGYGSLTLAYQFAGMHYQYNEVGLSYGQGGYFSPSYYVLAAVPATFTGHVRANFHYAISGALGVQTFQQQAAPFYPLDPTLQGAFKPSNGMACTAGQTPTYNCGYYPLQDTTLFTYAANAQVSYRFAGHWYGGGFLQANNDRNFNNVAGGFFLRFVFSTEHSPEGEPSGLFRLQGLRPLQIP